MPVAGEELNVVYRWVAGRPALLPENALFVAAWPMFHREMATKVQLFSTVSGRSI